MESHRRIRVVEPDSRRVHEEVRGRPCLLAGPDSSLERHGHGTNGGEAEDPVRPWPVVTSPRAPATRAVRS